MVVRTAVILFVFFLMIRRPPRSTQSRSSAASDVYKRQLEEALAEVDVVDPLERDLDTALGEHTLTEDEALRLSLIHISEPTRPY